MSKYQTLRMNPPKLQVKPGAREVHFTIISCMCDNVHKLTLKKNEQGDFRLYGNGFALSNYQFNGDVKTDCEWEADEGNWDNVFKFINSGTSVIESLKSR